MMSELYELPKGWEWKSLNEVCTKITDGAHKSPKTIENGYPYITVKDVDSNGRIDFDNCKLISEKDFELLTKGNCMPFNGDVLFSKDGTVGKVALVNYETPFVVLSSLAILRPSKFILSEYLQNFLQSPLFLEKAIKSKTGAAIKRVVLRTIKEFSIPLPPLQEQKRIVAKLDSLFAKIDQAITLHQQNIDEAEGFMGSVLNEVFGELEGRYGTIQLSNVLKISNQTLVPKDNQKYNYVGLENIESNSGKLVDYSATLGSEIKSSKVEFKKGMVLYGKLRPYLNKAWLATFDGVATTEILPFYPIENNQVDMSYVKYYFLSPKYLTKVMNNCSGARMPRLTTKFIKSKEAYIPLPPIETQQKTVTYLDQLSQKTEKLKQAQQEKMQSLKDLKASLLDRAFRGEM